MSYIKNVSQWLDNSARRFPDKIAFSDGINALSFSTLRNFARSIASELIRRHIFKQPILVVMDKEPLAIAAFLGCAYSGNFYAPVDPESPSDRLDQIRLLISPALELSKYNINEFISSLIDEDLLQLTFEKQTDQDLLYVLFTSGSTGVPKAVAIQHHSIIETTLTIQQQFGFSENSVHGHGVQIYNSSSFLPIYQTLLCGATDFLIPKKLMIFGPKLVDFLNEYKCNSIYWVSTSYAVVAKSRIFKKRRPKYLTQCMFTGTAMPTSILNEWLSVLPNAQYVNMMGLTESCGTYLYYIVNRNFSNTDQLPLGNPLKNVNVMLLNDKNEECQRGEIGEICIRSKKISCGYYNNKLKTSEKFVQNPLNALYPEIIFRTGDLGYINEFGEYMLAGRKDFQIKHMGYRIDPGEIESIVAIVQGVQLCACFYDDNLLKIVLVYTGSADISKIKEFLKLKLPTYMQPSIILCIEKMPLLASGKIDKRKLKKEYTACIVPPRGSRKKVE